MIVLSLAQAVAGLGTGGLSSPPAILSSWRWGRLFSGLLMWRKRGREAEKERGEGSQSLALSALVRSVA